MKPLKFRAAVSGRGSARFLPGLLALIAALVTVAVGATDSKAGLASRQLAGPLAGILPHPMYGITPLGDGVFGNPNAVNAAGAVVGDVMFTQGVFHAALWSGPTPLDLGMLGGLESGADGINSAGQVVGYADTRQSEGHAFLWQHGRMHDLGTLGGSNSRANGINSSGIVVGGADTPRTDSSGAPIHHAVLWQHGKARDLGTLGGDYSEAYAINDAGQVVGVSDTGQESAVGDLIRHAFLWQNGRMQDLGTLGGDVSVARAINRRGDVVGVADTGTATHAFFWQNGTMFDLGGTESVALGINDSGDIVGDDTDVNGDQTAFLVHDGTLFDLNSLIPSLAVLEHFEIASAINNSGQIAASGSFFVFPIGRIHKVALLTPCPTDVTGIVQVTMDQIKPTAQAGHFKQKVHLRNVTGDDIPGPISLVADNLQPPGVQVRNQGVTECLPPLGSPYVTLAGNLKHGQTRTVTLAFVNPSNQPITWTPRVLAGPGMR